MPGLMGIDIETYSSAPLPKCGVYRYCDAPDFEILLFSYAFDDEPVQTIDLARGETLPKEVISALEDPDIIKVAYNAQFERVCLSRYLGHWLDPHQWRCTMVMAAYLTLPGRLADAAVALGTTEKKMEEGKDLIRYFSVPCKPSKTNGGRTRNLPTDAPEKWAVYRQYNAQDVETERAIRKALEKYSLPEQEWELYALDQQINDRGVPIPQIYQGADYRLWIDRYYIAAQRLADESIRYAYLTRIHIHSELLANRSSIRKNGFALLDSEALAEFAAARRAMERYQTDYALRLSCPTEGGRARLNLDAAWSCA